MSDPETATSCYRHPDREARVRCQRCGRRICQSCMWTAPVGFQCPDCVLEARRAAPRALGVLEPPYLTYALIAVNVAVAVMGILQDPGWFDGRLGSLGTDFGLLGGALKLDRGGFSTIGVAAGEWYRIVTGAFLHAGPIHLGFNMLLLWQLGSLLEPVLGRPRFALLYTVSLLGGSFGALLLTPDTITVGASGAIFGLMGALFVIERSRGISAMQSSVGFLIVINLVLTFAIPGISMGGHLGGLVAGAGAGRLFADASRGRISESTPYAVGAAASVALFLGSLIAASFWDAPFL